MVFLRDKTAALSPEGKVLEQTADYFRDIIEPGSDVLEVAPFEAMTQMFNPGTSGLPCYLDTSILIPICEEEAIGDMRLIQGAHLFDTTEPRQLESGIIVPSWLAKRSGLEHRPYNQQVQYKCFSAEEFF